MEYKDAITKLLSLYGEDIVKDNFLLFSILSDYLGSSIYSKKLLSIFFEVNKRLNLYSLFKEHSLIEARNILSSDFKNHYYNCNSKEFVEAINPIAELLNPKEFQYYESKKIKESESTNQVEVVKVKKETSKQNSFRIDKNNNDDNSKDTSYKVNPKKKSILLESINVNVNNCKELYISSDNNSGTKYYLCKLDVASENLFIISCGEVNKDLTLSINDDHDGTYYLFVPKNKYKSLKVNQENGSLNIYGSNKNEEFICNNMKINIINGNLFLNSKTTSCDIKGAYGDITLIGTYSDLNIDKTKSNIRGLISFKSKKQTYNFTCRLARGKVFVNIEKLNKSIGKRLFLKRRLYLGDESIANKKLCIKIITLYGNIKIN